MNLVFFYCFTILNREITDVQEIEQDKHYVERFQLIPVDEQTYSYEQHTNHIANDQQGQIPSNGNQIGASDLIKRDSHSSDRELPIQEQQSVSATVYVTQTNDETEVLRYPSNAQVRYEDDTAYHHARYEYQTHSGHGNDDIKVELARNPQHHHQQQPSHTAKVQIYEQQDGGTRSDVIFLFLIIQFNMSEN